MTPHIAPQPPPCETYSNMELCIGIRETPDLYREENETDLTDAEILSDVFANTLETILAIFVNEDITPAYLAATMKAHAYCGEESELLPADLIPALLAGIRSRKADLGEDVNARIAELMDEVGEDE